MQDVLLLWIGIAACFVAAGFVKGVTGMGLPTIAMGLLGLAMPGSAAAALLVVPSLVTNVWQMVAGPRLGVIVRRLWAMQIGVVAGTFLTIGFLANSSRSEAGPVILGVVLAMYALTGLCSLRFSVPPRLEAWISPVIGILTGLLTGATGVFVIPAVPYLASMIPDKEELIQSLGFSFTVSTVALGSALAMRGAFTMQQASGSLLALAPALAGMYLGQMVRDRLQPETFRRWFFASLLLIGISMVARAAWLWMK
ncbi:MAG: sulfite exporter TauE/SafE family protein [Candidatus Methylacidiphilales bacterium]